MSDEQQTSLDRLALQMLESLQAAGVQQLAKPVAEASDTANSSPERPAQQAVKPTPPHEHSEPITAGLDARVSSPLSTPATLGGLETEVAACRRCEELAATRTQTVFGVGNPEARLCFLGEAPGADEDRLGEPFVGRGGQLLDKILSACKLAREEVYILNILRCRPPDNRNPTTEEAGNCRSFLDRQLQLVQPEFICCLGAVAAQNLLSTSVAIGRLRGKVHDYQGMKVVCTYHPAYLLRNPAAKKQTWDDMKMLMREMGTPVE